MSAARAVDSRTVLSTCERLGFACAGVAAASPSKWGEELRAWLAAGKHGSMEYLAQNVDARLDPTLILAGAKSVVMVGDLYARRGEVDEPSGGIGRIAKYARGRDYHEMMKKRLHALADELRSEFPGAEFRAFVDTAPLLEREHAAAAGLGWIGKNSLLINPRLGSYLFLGGLLTTLELESRGAIEADHCGTCTRCIEACPTGAITPYSIDASRCISYLTIERRLPIPTEFHRPIGAWIFGCDICQDVCPHNSARTGRPEEVRPDYTPRREGFDLLEVLGWTEDSRRSAFQSAALKRATLAMMKRNAVIAAGNECRRTGNQAMLERLRQVASDHGEVEMVRETAIEVLSALESPGRYSRGS